MNDQLAWKYKRLGATRASIDLPLRVGLVTIDRLPDNAPHDPGNFVGRHNGIRISDMTYGTLLGAQAEATRYITTLPQFAQASYSTVLNVIVEQGRQAYRDGHSVYANPFANAVNSIDRNNWTTGWLESFGAGVAAKAVNALTGTMQANRQLEYDVALYKQILANWRRAIDFALTLPTSDIGNWLDDWKKLRADELLELRPDWREFNATEDAKANAADK